ncbi:MAG: aminopeptidase N [Actinomycetales bacterium]
MGETNLTRDEARERARLLRVDRYEVYLDLDSGEDTFTTSTTVRFSCSEPGSDTFIDLIAPSVQGVTLNGRELVVGEIFDGARIRLEGLAAENELTVDAQGAYMNTGEGLHRFVDPVDDEVYLYSQFEVADARRVYACFDQPDLKASFALTVRAREHWMVISNSPTPKPEPLGYSGTNQWRFSPTPRISTYITAIIAGPYTGATGTVSSRSRNKIPLGVYCRASLAQHLDATEVMQVTKQGFAHFEKLFAKTYPFEKYDQVFVPEYNAGAMENAGAVTLTESYVFRSTPTDATVERRALTVLHELAHMWFGDLVTMRWWNDLWLNESFAEYASTACMAEATRWKSAWATFATLEKAWAYRQDQLPSTHPIVADIRDLDDVEVNFDGITYAKGASVLKQLVHYVGRDAFDEGIRRYFVEHAWDNTELEDLMSTLSRTSGRDLSEWTSSWLETAGVNTLRPALTATDGVIDSLEILQTAVPEHPVLRTHRLAVAGYQIVDESAKGPRAERIWRAELDVHGESTPVTEAVGRPVPDLLLVNDEDLTYAKIRLDEASLRTAVTSLSAFHDPLPRALLWGAAWDMTRDAEMPAGEYVSLVLRNACSETDSSVLMSLLRQMQSASALYVPPARRTTVRDEAADALIDLAAGAAAGSDQQLQLVKSAATFVRTPAHCRWARDLFDGTLTLDRLKVDTDLRWDLLIGLAAAGAATEGEIDAELTRDSTASGRQRAATARACIPTPEAKARAWALVMDSDDLPNATQQAILLGFTRVHDLALLEPFVDPYFEALRTIWDTRTSEMAQQLVIGLFPTRLTYDWVLKRAETWLSENTDQPAPLIRLVTEATDEMRRAIRIQALDA